MLQITVPETEYFDEQREIFILVKEQTLILEHSLVSMSKWESRWNKPFLAGHGKTQEESIDYIRCMTITQNVDPLVYQGMTDGLVTKIAEYISAPMTATVFAEEKSSGTKEVITSELLYYYMTALNIPFECQKWHLNRLLTLIRVCNIKNSPPKKMSRQEILQRNRELNDARRKELNTKG